MIQFIKKYWSVLLLSLILLIISILSINTGKYLLSNDNYSPELNPTLSVQRYIESPTWRSYRVLGFASESEQADVFRSGLFVLFNTFLPIWSLAQLFSLLCLVVGTLSTAYLVTLFVRDFVSTKYSAYLFLLSGIFYLTTLWSAWVFNFNIMPYVTQFGFLPLLLLSIYLLFREWRWYKVLLLLISSVLFTSSFVIATVFFVNIVLITVLTFYLGLVNRNSIKRILFVIGLFLITQFFWLVPFSQYTLSTSQDLINSFTNRAITANTIDLEADMMTLANSARFYTRLLGTVDNPEIDSFIFPMSEDFQAYDIYKFVGLIPFMLSILGLVFVIAKKQWKLLPIWIVLFGLLFLIKNQNPPLGGIYVWLQENFNIFKQVFRWVSSKLSQPYLILLVLTSTIGFLYFIEFLGSFFKEREKKLFILIPIILFTVSPLFYSEYMFKGQLFTSRALVELPPQYNALKEVLEEDTTGRIFYAPPANNGYFREYNWGFVGSQFLAYVLPNPLMDMSLAIGSDVGENAMLELTNDFNSGNLQELNRDLLKYDVKYILVDRSLVKGRYGYELNWDLINQYTQSWEMIWSEEFLELYVLKETKSNRYVESIGKNDVLDNNFFVRKYSVEPTFTPLNLDLNDARVEGNYLVKDIEYRGVNSILYSNYRDLEILTLPTTIKKIGSDIFTSPSLPSIKGLGNGSYKKFVLPNSLEYLFVVGNNVFNQGELDRGVNLYNGWDSIKSVLISSKGNFKKLNLTSKLSETKPGDCSGGSYSILPDVIPESITSGFKIEGNTDLPCIYTPVSLEKKGNYVIEVVLNWESTNSTLMGYCLNSSLSGNCLNIERFLYTDKGFGNMTLNIPTVVKGEDNISLVLYALNPKGEKASLTVRDVEVRYSNEFVSLTPVARYVDSKEKSLEINSGEILSVKVPIMNNGKSYVFSSSQKENIIWQPSIAEDKTLTYEIGFDNGLKQVTRNQYINQYQVLFETTPLKKYLWYWSGENRKNIPSSVCLTYVGDDKCMVDSTLYDDMYSSEVRIFSPSIKEGSRMDASFNSISFHNETENVLRNFVVMEIPEQWFHFNFKPILPKQYTEDRAQPIGNSPNSTFYKLEKLDRTSRDTIISIPQAKSDAWVAIGFTDIFFKFLPGSSRVYLEGWKQGWDISGMNNINTVFIFYWPNILGYIGYILIPASIGIVTVYLIKERKRYERK